MTHNNVAIREKYRFMFEEVIVRDQNYRRASDASVKIERQIRTMSPAERREFVVAAATWLLYANQHTDPNVNRHAQMLLLKALQPTLPFEHDDIVLLIDWSLSQTGAYY